MVELVSNVLLFLASFLAVILVIYRFGFRMPDTYSHEIYYVFREIMRLFLALGLLRFVFNFRLLRAEKGFWVEVLVLFFLFYALLRLLVSMLVTVLGLVNKLPVIGTVNRGLGWLVGGATALLDIYLVLCILWGIIVITGGNLNVLNDTVMSSSLYYKIFNLFNPFL